MKKTAQQRILELLKNEYPAVYSSGALQRTTFYNEDGTQASPAVISRRLRGLEESSLVAVRYEGAKHHAWYRYLQEWERSNYIPTSQRTEQNKCWKDPSLVKALKYKVEFIREGNIVREKKVYA